MTESESYAWVEEEFSRCRDWIQSAVDRGHGETNLEIVKQKIMDGRAQLWPLPQSAVITQVNTFDTGRKALWVWLCGGDLKEIEYAVSNDIAMWGREKGCTQMVVSGRRGWLKCFRKFGGKEIYTCMGVDL